MKTTDKLRKELERATLREMKESDDREIAQIKKDYIGRCFADKSIRDKATSKVNHAIYIADIQRYPKKKHGFSAGTIVLTCYKVGMRKIGSRASSNFFCYERGLHRYDVKPSWSTTSMSSYIYNMVRFMKLIPMAKFNALYLNSREINAFAENLFNGQSELSSDVLKTGADQSDQNELVKNMQELGIGFWDLEQPQYIELLDCLKYSHIPGFVEGRFLQLSFAKQSLELQIKLNEKRMSEPWTKPSFIALKQRENDIIRSFISRL